MSTATKLANTRPVSHDKAFYFGDAAYSDMREIVCHERPIIFVLHYYFGLDVPYDLLRDRYFFSLTTEGELTPASNLMMDFFERSGIVTNVSVPAKDRAIEEVLEREYGPTTALILPTAKIVAGDRLVTSVMVEGGADSLLVSSLRGDDFYIRREELRKDFTARLALDNDTLQFVRVTVPSGIVQGNDFNSFTREMQSFSTRELTTIFSKFRTAQSAGKHKIGADALAEFLDLQQAQLVKYTQQISEGFNNVLLARVLWPMTFCYLPFVIASRRMAERHSLSPEVGALALSIGDLTGLAANLGHLYARSPVKASGDRFFGTLGRIIEEYRRLERLVLSETPPQ